ncbi:MAG: hypothetical protein QXI58_00650 [Candidatus Micrarchaeia archaeon]
MKTEAIDIFLKFKFEEKNQMERLQLLLTALNSLNKTMATLKDLTDFEKLYVCAAIENVILQDYFDFTISLIDHENKELESDKYEALLPLKPEELKKEVAKIKISDKGYSMRGFIDAAKKDIPTLFLIDEMWESILEKYSDPLFRDAFKHAITIISLIQHFSLDYLIILSFLLTNMTLIAFLDKLEKEEKLEQFLSKFKSKEEE